MLDFRNQKPWAHPWTMPNSMSFSLCLYILLITSSWVGITTSRPLLVQTKPFYNRTACYQSPCTRSSIETKYFYSQHSWFLDFLNCIWFNAQLSLLSTVGTCSLYIPPLHPLSPLWGRRAEIRASASTCSRVGLHGLHASKFWSIGTRLQYDNTLISYTCLGKWGSGAEGKTKD